MVTTDRVLELLAENRRRYALYYLADRDAAVSVDDLANGVARMEADDEPSDERRDRVEVALTHTHLPTIERTEFVDYDQTDGTVELTTDPPAFAAVLSVARALERPA